jgi:hypothetical protein
MSRPRPQRAATARRETAQPPIWGTETVFYSLSNHYTLHARHPRGIFLALLVWKRAVESTGFRVELLEEGHVLDFVLTVVLVGETPTALTGALCLSSLTYFTWCYHDKRILLTVTELAVNVLT